MAFISKEIETLLNKRILEEEISSRLYLCMSKWLNFNGYLGASKLWEKYSKEELSHADWAYEYLENLDILPEVPELIKQQCEFKDLQEICKLSYEHEIFVTESCNELAKVALKENDFMTLELAQKYLKEQNEEINRQVTWLDKLEAFGTSKEALRLLDNEMGS